MNGFQIHLPTQRSSTKLIKVAAILIMLLTITQPVFADTINPGVYDPDSKPYGFTINQWTAVWWQYILSFPASTNPLVDPTGANCADRQFGPVFFLAGSTGGSSVRDKCVVPYGKSILFPIINVIGAVPDDVTNATDLISLVTWYENGVDYVEASVDGVELQDLYDNYRFQSPIFPFYGATPGVFSPYYEGFHEIGLSDGWWIMLKPLARGKHTIHFKGHQSVPELKVDFTIEVTYNIKVK